MINDGEINVRRTHPTLYRMLMAIALVGIGLSINFFFLKPTFPIWGVPNIIWGGIFLVVSINSIVSLNFYRRLEWVRATMGISTAYFAIMAVGTTAPSWKGDASFQLPLVYALVVAFQFFLLKEPFLNPETAK